MAPSGPKHPMLKKVQRKPENPIQLGAEEAKEYLSTKNYRDVLKRYAQPEPEKQFGFVGDFLRGVASTRR